MKFWKSYYCRWNPRMRPQDSVHLRYKTQIYTRIQKLHSAHRTKHIALTTLRHAQLLSLRDQLKAKVDVLNKELDSKVPCQVV